MSTFQPVDLTITTDSGGSFTFSFDNPIDMALVSPASPQSGQDAGLIGVSCTQTGAKQVTCRVWRTGASFTAKPAANEEVEVVLLGITG